MSYDATLKKQKQNKIDEIYGPDSWSRTHLTEQHISKVPGASPEASRHPSAVPGSRPPSANPSAPQGSVYSDAQTQPYL